MMVVFPTGAARVSCTGKTREDDGSHERVCDQ